MKTNFRIAALILTLLAIASLSVVLSKNGRLSKTLSERRETAAAPVDALQQPALMPEGMGMGAHMRMTAPRGPRPGDQERADRIAARARAAIEEYKDYNVALRDGYRILQPRVPQKMYHFNNAQYFLEAESRF